MIEQSIFTRLSLQPLLDIWTQIESDVVAGSARQQAGDIRGEFSVLINAWKAKAQGNTDQFYKFAGIKSKQRLHEETCATRVQETYRDFLAQYNQKYGVNAIGLGALGTNPSPQTVPHPGNPFHSPDPIAYALRLARFHEQHWASASVFLHYMDNAFNQSNPNKAMKMAAHAIETQRMAPLHQRARDHWLTLLVIGGTPEDLQHARQSLASRYASGELDTREFLNTPMGSDANHPMQNQLRNALGNAMNNPKSNIEPSVGLDLGL